LATSPLDQYRLQPLGFRCIRRRHLAGPQIRHRSIGIGGPFNLEKPANDYQTGTESHLEFALMRHIGKDFSFGLAGYHSQQITGDSGAGARLGDFKGRVSAVGPMLTYSVTVDKPRSVPPSAGCTSSM
jgi:hypothetical protein